MISHTGEALMEKLPDRYRNAVVPHIYVDGAADAITFYEKAFGAAAAVPRRRQGWQDRAR
jgi:hypothetical protein